MHSQSGTYTYFKPTSHGYNLPIAVPREENLTEITNKSLPPPVAVVTEEEEQISAENTQEELIQWDYHL